MRKEALQNKPLQRRLQLDVTSNHPTRHKDSAPKRVAAFVFLMATMVVMVRSACFLAEAFENVKAITLPFGTVYFIDNPEKYLIDHEECHVEQINDEGALSFYTRYLMGGDACKIELACGYAPGTMDILQHPACRMDPPGTIASADASFIAKPSAGSAENPVVVAVLPRPGSGKSTLQFYASVR